MPIFTVTLPVVAASAVLWAVIVTSGCSTSASEAVAIVTSKTAVFPAVPNPTLDWSGRKVNRQFAGTVENEYVSSRFPVFLRTIVYVTSAPAGTVSSWELSHVRATPRRATRSRAMFRGSGLPDSTRLVDFRYSTLRPFCISETRAVTEYVAEGRTRP